MYAAALREAEVIRSEAEAEAARMRREVDDYVDGKLANFEVALHKTLTAVERGRDKIRGRHESRVRRPRRRPAPAGLIGPTGTIRSGEPGGAVPWAVDLPRDRAHACPALRRRTLNRLDPRAPLVLDTRELGRRAGALKR